MFRVSKGIVLSSDQGLSANISNQRLSHWFDYDFCMLRKLLILYFRCALLLFFSSGETYVTVLSVMLHEDVTRDDDNSSCVTWVLVKLQEF